jgi:hypothetical protein
MSPEERQQHDAMDDMTEDAAQDDSTTVEQVCRYTTRGCGGRPGWRSRGLGGARLHGGKRAFTMPIPSDSRGSHVVCRSHLAWLLHQARPEGSPREEPRAVRNGCGHRRQGVHTSSNVPHENQFTLRHPSVEDHAVKEGP